MRLHLISTITFFEFEWNEPDEESSGKKEMSWRIIDVITKGEESRKSVLLRMKRRSFSSFEKLFFNA